MYNIILFNDNITNGYNIIGLDIIAIVAILCGAFVIVTKNPIVSVLFLIGLFLSISLYLMVLGINFIGLSYLLVYVGAVSILFLFILMLINVRISEIITTTSNSIPLGIIIGSLFFFTIYNVLPKISNISSTKTIGYNIVLEKNDMSLYSIYNTIKVEIYKYIYNFYNFFKIVDTTSNDNNVFITEFTNKTMPSLNLTYSQNWDSMLGEVSHINTLGNILYSNFSIWIILTSLILLLAMVGAIVITLKN